MATHTTVIQHAPEHHTFAPGSFDNQIGKTVPLTIEGRQLDNCKIMAAEISEDGSAVTLTLELPDSITFPVGAVSIGTKE